MRPLLLCRNWGVSEFSSGFFFMNFTGYSQKRLKSPMKMSLEVQMWGMGRAANDARSLNSTETFSSLSLQGKSLIVWEEGQQRSLPLGCW